MKKQTIKNNGALAASLLRIVLRLSRRLRMGCKNRELTSSALLALGILHRRTAATASEMATELAVKKQSLTALLAELENAGLIAKSPSPEDGRKTLIAMTEAGKNAFLRDLGERRAYLDGLMETLLAPADRAALEGALPALEKLAHAAAASRGKPA